MKFFMQVLLVVVYLGVFYVNSASIQDIFQCQPGVRYEKNECDQCFCLDIDNFVCTMNPCDKNKVSKLENCSSGQKWLQGCNTCWCIDVGTVCTKYECNN